MSTTYTRSWQFIFCDFFWPRKTFSKRLKNNHKNLTITVKSIKKQCNSLQLFSHRLIKWYWLAVFDILYIENDSYLDKNYPGRIFVAVFLAIYVNLWYVFFYGTTKQTVNSLVGFIVVSILPGGQVESQVYKQFALT